MQLLSLIKVTSGGPEFYLLFNAVSLQYLQSKIVPVTAPHEKFLTVYPYIS